MYKNKKEQIPSKTQTRRIALSLAILFILLITLVLQKEAYNRNEASIVTRIPQENTVVSPEPTTVDALQYDQEAKVEILENETLFTVYSGLPHQYGKDEKRITIGGGQVAVREYTDQGSPTEKSGNSAKLVRE